MNDKSNSFDVIELRRIFRTFRDYPSWTTAFPFDAVKVVNTSWLLRELAEMGAPVTSILESPEWRRDAPSVLAGWIAVLDNGFNNYEDVLSPSAFIIDSRDVLAVLQVRADYMSVENPEEPNYLRSELDSGYKPHIDLIKSLPLSYFNHPGYFAPVEDLLDYLGVEFYAGSNGGVAADGAVGWLLREIISAKSNLGITEEEVLDGLSKGLEYWKVGQLKGCLNVWDSTVGPILIKSRR